jgi:hypothetical protein
MEKKFDTEHDEFVEKITRGLNLAVEKVIEEVMNQKDGYIVVSEGGKVVRISSEELRKRKKVLSNE